MIKFSMLIGVPGCGKSTLAKSLNADVILSSDGIRKELYGDEAIQGDGRKVFTLMQKRTVQALKEGKSVVYDACNVTPKSRRSIMEAITKLNVEKIAYVIATPIEICKQQNAQRERNVPEEVIDRMAKIFKFPLYSEGFTEIKVHYNKEEYKNYYGVPFDAVKYYKNYNQNNPWHPEGSLGSHLLQVASGAAQIATKEKPRYATVMYIAGLLHDVGKPYCEFKDTEGISHYYNHDSVSALMAMNYNIELEEKYKFIVYQIISYHMAAHSFTNDKKTKVAKTLEKNEPLLYDLLIKFAKADSEGIKVI